MFSYEQRLKTFINKKWPTKDYKSNPQLMAICGYICKSTPSNLAAMCVYCKKHLEGWEKSDVPILEHYSHKKDCILFSPHKLALNNKPSFIRYDLKDGMPFEFCYKCGSIDTLHNCTVTKKYKLSLKKSSEFFFIRLISGEYNDIIDLYLSKTLYLSLDIKDIFRTILENHYVSYFPFKTVKELISEFINNEIQAMNDKITNEIEEYKNKYL